MTIDETVIEGRGTSFVSAPFVCGNVVRERCIRLGGLAITRLRRIPGLTTDSKTT